MSARVDSDAEALLWKFRHEVVESLVLLAQQSIARETDIFEEQGSSILNKREKNEI